MKKFVCESLEEFLLENEGGGDAESVQTGIVEDCDEEEISEEELEERDETVSKGLITPEDRKVMSKKTVSPYANTDGKGADRWAKKHGAGTKGAYRAN